MGLVGVCFVFTIGFCYRFNAPVGRSFYRRRRMSVLALHTGSLAVHIVGLICYCSPADRQVTTISSEHTRSLVKLWALICSTETCWKSGDNINRLTPNDPYMGRTAPLTSKRCILYIYSTNIGTEYFKHALYSPFFCLQNAVCFIMVTCLVPVLFTFYIQGVLKLKKIIPAPKG